MLDLKSKNILISRQLLERLCMNAGISLPYFCSFLHFVSVTDLWGEGQMRSIFGGGVGVLKFVYFWYCISITGGGGGMGS